MFKFQYTLSHSEEVFYRTIYGIFYEHAEEKFKKWLKEKYGNSVRSWKYI